VIDVKTKPPGRQGHGEVGPRTSLTVDDVFEVYTWAFEGAHQGREVDPSLLGDPELALAVCLAIEDAATGQVRSPAAVAERIEAALGVALQPSLFPERDLGDLRPGLDRELFEDIRATAPEALAKLRLVRKPK